VDAGWLTLTLAILARKRNPIFRSLNAVHHERLRLLDGATTAQDDAASWNYDRDPWTGWNDEW